MLCYARVGDEPMLCYAMLCYAMLAYFVSYVARACSCFPFIGDSMRHFNLSWKLKEYHHRTQTINLS